MDSSPPAFTTPEKPTTKMSPMAPVKAKKTTTTALTPPSTPKKEGHYPSSCCMSTPPKDKNYMISSRKVNVVMSSPVTNKMSKNDTRTKPEIMKPCVKTPLGPFASTFRSWRCKKQMKNSAKTPAATSSSVTELYHEWIVYRDFTTARGGAAVDFVEYLAGEISFHRRHEP